MPDKEFKERLIKVYGKQGQQWLDHLPPLITKLSKEWNLQNLIPIKNLSYNKEIFEQRIITFAKLFNTEALRIKNWCFVQATLPWIWGLEDHDTIASEYFQKIVQILAIE